MEIFLFMKSMTKENSALSSGDSKKEYIKPSLKEHGGLSELVQLRPDRGHDGETRWIDCTS